MEKTIQKSIAQQLNATLPTFSELSKTLAGHELSARIVSPFTWATGWDDKRIINMAMNNMCVQMQGIPFCTMNGDDWLVKDWRGNEYPFSGEDFECLLKIMFCSWMQIGIIDENNQDLYFEFKGQPGVFQVLD